MCEWLYCGFIYGEFFAFPFRRETKTKPLIASADAIILDECNEWFNLAKYIVDMQNEDYPYIDMIPH